MRQPVDPKIVSAIIKAGGNGRITLRTYAPSGSGSYSGVPVSVLKESGLASPSAREAQRQRFGRAISLNRIETALRGAHCGNMMQLTDLSRETVETDPHLGAILNKRFGALSSLPYEVRPASGYGVDKEKAQFYAAVVWEQLKNLTHFRRTLRQLAWALFDGRAAVELFWRKVVGPSHESFGTVGLAVTATGWIHPRRLSFGSQRELVCTNEYGSIGAGNFSVVGVVLDAVAPGKFITWQPQLFGEYQEREGLAPRCMYWSFFKRYSQRDRMILMELFGKPWRIVETDEDSQASSEDLEAAEEAADGLGAAYTARMPRGIKLTVVQPGRTAGQVHDKVIEDCDKQLSKLVLGQTGTTDAVPAGLNSNQASMMQDEQLMVLTADAIELSEIGENQLTDQIIAANFGYSELPHAPTFILRSDLPVNRLEEVERLTAALNAGLEVSLSEAYEISGFRQPERNEPVLKVDQPPTPSLAPTPPAARPVIVWPPNASPPTGEQQPLTPQAGTGEGAREGAGISVGSADQKTIVTVNEAREGQGLPPLVLPGGQSDPDGDLTVSEYEAKIAKRHGKPAGTGPVGQQFKKNADSIEPNLVPPPLLNSTSATIQLIVRKSGDQWCVYSEDGSRSFGCYGTREAAEERLKQVEAFKHMDEQDDVLALSATFEKLRQPETVNGSVEDVIERGKPDIQRVVNEWAEEFLSAVDKVKSIGEVTREINRVVGRLDQNAFAEAMEHALLHSAALGALDCWFDEESGTTVAPATFEVPATDPKFAKKPFADAIEYFQAKNVVTKETFERLSETAQRKAFTVAALTQQNMLGAVHVELARHVGQGADIRSFRTFLKGRLEEAGYTAASTKAEAAYVDNVFRTNTLGAYNAGRYERQTQPEVLRLRPYWQIRTVSDNRRRETHARADGLVLRADDPFWQRCYPPMGFSCRCRIVSLSAKQAENMVITDGSTIDYLPDPGFTSGVRSLMSAQWPRDPVVKIMLENLILLERDVQTLVFDKTKFETRESALAWAKEHGFKHSTLRETENSWRVRQRPPKDFKDGTMRTKQIANGVSIVDGELKE